jgi:hypothetical protein
MRASEPLIALAIGNDHISEAATRGFNTPESTCNLAPQVSTKGCPRVRDCEDDIAALAKLAAFATFVATKWIFAISDFEYRISSCRIGDHRRHHMNCVPGLKNGTYAQLGPDPRYLLQY